MDGKVRARCRGNLFVTGMHYITRSVIHREAWWVNCQVGGGSGSHSDSPLSDMPNESGFRLLVAFTRLRTHTLLP